MHSAAPPSATFPAQPSHRAMEQAAQWYALLSAEDVSDNDHTRWQAWLNRDPEHRLAWRYVESVSSRFKLIKTTTDPRGTADGLWQANTRLRQRRRVLASLGGLAGAGLLGWAGWRHTPLPVLAQAWQADYRTATGETRKVVLSDGSRVWLNTATAFNQDYDRRQRRLQLITGEILIDTANDPARPFFVETHQGRLRALGTRFTVRQDNDQTFLAVYDGAVEVRSRSGAVTVLQAGQQTRFTPNAVDNIQQADVAREAWSRGVLVAQDIPLGEVVAELRRYRNGHLGIAPEVANLRVLGNFPLNDTDDTLNMLAEALPVRITRTLSWWVSIEAKD